MTNLSTRIAAVFISLVAFGGLAGCQCCNSTAPSGPKVIEASDDAAIQDALPKDITIEGNVSSVDVGDDVISIHFVGADKSGFYAVVLERGRDAMEKAYGDGLKNLRNQKIKVIGKLTLYRGKPEIILNAPQQVVVEGPAT